MISAVTLACAGLLLSVAALRSQREPTLAPVQAAAPAPPVAQFDGRGLLPLTALAKLSAQVGVPMGVEWVGPGEGSPVNRQWHNASVVSIAQQILNAQAPQWAYRAIWDQRTLLLRPAKTKLGGHSVLDVRLPAFVVIGQRPMSASGQLADILGKYLLSGQSPKAFVWTGSANLDAVKLTRSFANEPAYRILDWMAAAGAESFWLVEDLPACRIAGTNVWCTYTHFGAFRKPARQPAWMLLNWRSDPMDVTNPTVVNSWQCLKCSLDLAPLAR